jgi:hypothetical protein
VEDGFSYGLINILVLFPTSEVKETSSEMGAPMSQISQFLKIEARGLQLMWIMRHSEL